MEEEVDYASMRQALVCAELDSILITILGPHYIISQLEEGIDSIAAGILQ